jgi:hypothetical protein
MRSILARDGRPTVGITSRKDRPISIAVLPEFEPGSNHITTNTHPTCTYSETELSSKRVRFQETPTMRIHDGEILMKNLELRFVNRYPRF